jgi:nicotinamide mononucleotide adenylyltransferase
MQNILVKGNGEGTGWAMFIGRWQPWHKGHRWLIDQQLNQGKKVCIAIRDMEPDEKNPYSAIQVMMNITNELIDLIEDGMIRIMIIPDIESINFGRGVGYDIIEHVPPADIHDISATKIREQMHKNGENIL